MYDRIDTFIATGYPTTQFNSCDVMTAVYV